MHCDTDISVGFLSLKHLCCGGVGEKLSRSTRVMIWATIKLSQTEVAGISQQSCGKWPLYNLNSSFRAVHFVPLPWGGRVFHRIPRNSRIENLRLCWWLEVHDRPTNSHSHCWTPWHGGVALELLGKSEDLMVQWKSLERGNKNRLLRFASQKPLDFDIPCWQMKSEAWNRKHGFSSPIFCLEIRDFGASIKGVWILITQCPNQHFVGGVIFEARSMGDSCEGHLITLHLMDLVRAKLREAPGPKKAGWIPPFSTSEFHFRWLENLVGMGWNLKNWRCFS